jgi:ubiquinone/menaquinone biosynthesis C-methylase UbiE
MGAIRYLHGYSSEEQRRLHRQARTFAPLLHRELRFAGPTRLLEIGCGAGAQTAIMLRQNPALRVVAVDRSASHLAAARRYFARRRALAEGRLELLEAEATKLPLEDGSFDAALSVWLLEHAADPLGIVREARRVLKAGGRLYVREVFNASVYIRPLCPALEEYWAAYNALQYELGGNPNIGMHLGNVLRKAGFRDIRVALEAIWLDRRQPALRRHWLRYWLELMLSAAPNLLANRRVVPKTIAGMKREFARLEANPEAVFFFAPVFGYAEK